MKKGYNNVPKLDDAMLKGIERALEACGILVEGTAIDHCGGFKKSTGRLRGSITHQVDMSDMKVRIGTNVEYAPYVEFGTGIYAKGGKGRKTPWIYKDDDGVWHRTKGQKPNPFLRPAFDENKKDARDLYRREIKAELMKVAK